MTMFFYYMAKPETQWLSALENTKEKVIAEQKPPFTTVLMLDPLQEDGMTAEEIQKTKYKGPFYADFDSNAETFQTVIDKFNEFLTKLEGMDIDLNQVELFATGGKGFHVMVPQLVFIPKPPPAGQIYLPYIYKEMAQKLFVETLDMRVYTGRKGRMWRTPNVKRTNDKYKVQITAAEARAMTIEAYAEIVSAPRPLIALAPPVMSNPMSVLYATASATVNKAHKGKKGAGKLDAKLLAKFKNEYPPTLVKIMEGEVKPGVGFQNLAMQISIAGNAFGKDEDQLVKDAANLIANHQGDGVRYNTPAKRETELRRMAAYTKDNALYTFSAPALRACASDSKACTDLDDTVEMAPVSSTGEVSEEDMRGITLGVEINESGIWVVRDGVKVRVSSLGMANPKELVDRESGDTLGYEVDCYIDKQFKGKKLLDLSCFQSRILFQKFSLQLGSVSLQATDNQTSALADLLRLKAGDAGKIYTVSQEGFDIVTIRGPDGQLVEDHIYVSKDGIEALTGGEKYRLRSMYSGSKGEMDCDLHTADPLENTPESRRFMQKFLALNTPAVVARCFGWYMASFLSPLIRKKFNQFPLLQVVGPAGAGKSKYTEMMMALFYHHNRPKIFSASNLTGFALDNTLNASASIPVVFDELKASEITKAMHDKLKTAFRGNYTGLMSSKGRVDMSKTKDALSNVSLQNRAPLSFIGEALESQTAIVDRCIIVPMSEAGREGTTDDFEECFQNKAFLTQLGCAAKNMAMTTSVKSLADRIVAHRKVVQAGLPARTNVDRPAFNYAVVLTGLEFARAVLEDVFGEDFGAVFGDKFEEFNLSIMNNLDTIIPRNISEASKVMGVLAHLSKEGRPGDTKLQHGEDYVEFFAKNDPTAYIDLKMRACYDKYRRHVRSIGEEPLYPNFDAFFMGFNTHPALVDRHCKDNMDFRGSVMGPFVYRFDLRKLYENEGVELFDALPLDKVEVTDPTRPSFSLVAKPFAKTV